VSRLLATPSVVCPGFDAPNGGAASDQGKEPYRFMNDYEILLMLDPELADERQSEILARTQELVSKHDGEWESHEPWGRRRLAYEIDHKSEGSYHLLTFRSTAETLDEISRVLKITDGVMRHMATRRPAQHRRPAKAPSAPPPVEVAVAADPEDGGEE
jgi:small subunit ribosomal protein S6